MATKRMPVNIKGNYQKMQLRMILIG